MENRNPKKGIKDILKKEVNFGCPIEGCGSPYLTYHHFDPPWHKIYEHHPDKMIALCLPHHNSADHGAFTNEQLYSLKKNPFLKSNQSITGKFLWNRKAIFLFVGSHGFLNPYIEITKSQKPIFRIYTVGNENGLINFYIV